jgi:hypothetical protein
MMDQMELSLISSLFMGNNSDKEEVERFERSFSRCRTCDHVLISHSFIKPYCGRCVDATVKPTGEYKGCECRLFVPKDNLEFLEWVADKKSKETK